MFARRSATFIVLLLATGPLPAQSTLHETIEQVLPKMVKIFGAGGFKGLHAYSTGFLISPEGHIATVAGSVLDAEEVTVVLHNGRRYTAKVIGMEPQLDLAVLKIQAENLSLPHFDLGDVGTAAPGTRVLAFSNMFKVAVGDEPVSVLHGVISAQTELSARRGVHQVPYKGPVFVVDAIVNNPGAGGGVITTRDGKLLGMIGKELRDAGTSTWINYSIPIKQIQEPVAAIVAGKYISQRPPTEEEENPGRYAPVDFGLVMVPDVLYRTPAYIDTVLTGSHAAKAGLRRDDLVLFVNDQLVQSVRHLKQELGRLKPGDTLRLIVRRGQSLITVELPIEAKPEQ